MLKVEDNTRITQVGPGTPMGDMMRRYWIPALLSSELPSPDCEQVRVRLLGEDLIAYRDTEGHVGLIDAFCPHRRAPLFFGRNEECGIRCVYHGWKFDRHGDCVDMPSEPAGTTLQAKVKIKAYPCVDKGGVIWAYMGPKDLQPAPPDYAWMRAPATHRFVSKTYEDCNYLQAMEGGFDTAHSSYLHNEHLQDNTANLRQRDKAPRIEVERTDYGFVYSSTRNVGADNEYIRVNHFVMPFHQTRGAVAASDKAMTRNVPKVDGHMWVPIDDTSCYVYNMIVSFNKDEALDPDYCEEWESWLGRGQNDFIPGTFRLKQNMTNNYLIDRERQRHETFSDIVGVNTQDFALQEGMGKIVDRSREFLGTSDKAIIALRRQLLEGAHLVEEGKAPCGVEPATHKDVIGYDGLLSKGNNWKTSFAEQLKPNW